MKYFTALIFLACGYAQAEGARLGIEYELEKDRKTGIRNHAVTVQPGWEFAAASPINLVELLIERSVDEKADADGSRGHATKFFLRIGQQRDLTQGIGYYLRGGAGRSFTNERDFNYAYIEPGLKLDMSERWELTLGVRVGDAIGGVRGERILKYIIAPAYALDKRNELEFQYVRSRGDEDAWSLGLGYVHRF